MRLGLLPEAWPEIEPEEPFRYIARMKRGGRWEPVELGDQTWRMHDPNPALAAAAALAREITDKQHAAHEARLQEVRLLLEASDLETKTKRLQKERDYWRAEFFRQGAALDRERESNHE